MKIVARRRTLEQMGLAKRMMQEAEDRMFSPTGGAVCRSHVRNLFLLDQLGEAQDAELCPLCGESATSYVGIDDVRDLVVAVIRQYRRRAIDGLFHDRESESGYALPDGYIEDTWDVVDDLFEFALDDDLRYHIGANLASDQWFRPGVLWLDGTELYVESWAGFRLLLRSTEARLKQLLDGSLDGAEWRNDAADGIRPSELLPRLIEIIDDLGFMTVTPPPMVWLRALHVPADGTIISASRLGTAPTALSSENRMNRAGEPMFYGAADADTARAEIGTPEPGHRTVLGAWAPTRPLRVLDLVTDREVPDFFDVNRAGLRWRLLFLADFAGDVSQPVGPHQRAEYRATQVFMDFLRSQADVQLDGIMYRSSHTGQPCCALNVDNRHCVESGCGSGDGVLRLVLNQYDQDF